MSKPVNIWFATYVGEQFIVTAPLTGHECGALWLITGALWDAGGSLPDNDKRLAQIAKATPRQWKEIKASLSHLFKIEGGRISIPRLDLEIAKAKELSEKKRAAGIASGKARAAANKEQVFNRCSAGDEPRAGSGNGASTKGNSFINGELGETPFKIVEGGK